MRSMRTALVAITVGTGLALAACAPGSGSDSGAGDSTAPAPDSVQTDAAALGDVTLTVWDQEVRGGQAKQMETLNAEFQKKYPNIKLERVSRSFDDLVKTLRLALSGADAPDVVQANNTRSQMGNFVTAGQLVNLDPYAAAYGWVKRYPQSVRNVASYSPDGKTFGSGSLFGMPQVGELVGIFYNDAKLKTLGINPPKTWADFDAALATAKSKGEVPLVLGNLEKWPAGHVFGVLQGRFTPAEDIRTLGFGQRGGNWATPENTKAAQTLVDWVDKGYFNSGVNGLDYDPAWQNFTKGQGLFLIAGSWLQADLSNAMKADVKFMLPPAPEAGGTPVTTGGSGLPFAITQKAKNKDAAAAYINFITSPEAMKVLADNGNLPVVETAEQAAPDALATDVFAAFDQVTKEDGLVPYLDWATPTMGDTLGATLQDLLAKKATPEKALETLQKDYGDFTAQ
ncbi:sugar ABC transporter substrate-binding protein [Knoellia sinensis KCTC 19936]|uniref:Sugar ABC transporter substrate-binding protein n=1 Tax=Knoellia sinensis KCTC 19936 TaxID=1385520 RepID=A0A0A0JGV7_9MICO|nr:extracellular solute-binding protein [Knoellia sinensis]KGN34861.1 sugar ABC transporter substrate-binding protein [Knoellia sinensis KCTC 19936]